jgi:hypothetical protein
MTRRQKSDVWLTLTFIFLGYLGAANFYSALIGLSAPQLLPCLICPHIDSLGHPLPKFFWRVALLGSCHALLFLAVGRFLVFLVRTFRHDSAED